ncbi:MAG: hypothetical protein ACYCY9_02075 [Thiobacillus sp.]
MKRIAAVLAMSAVCFASQSSASSCGTDKLCVPGDFPSPNGADFSMDLLGGDVYLDFPLGGSVGGFTLTNLQPINFHASPFANPTDVSVGTSSLMYSAISHYSLGTISVFDIPAEFYLEGVGVGELVDIDGTKGDWSLNIPLHATWNGTVFDFGNVLLSTAATYSYNSGYKTISAISGQSMNYATGNAFLVGQAMVTGENPFLGLRITLGLNGNDPVVTSVPEASVVWQLLAGLGLLGVVVRIRNRSLRLDSMPKAVT